MRQVAANLRPSDKLATPAGRSDRPSGLAEPRTAYSCVVDVDSHIQRQFVLWLHCVLHVQQILPSDVFVHLTPHPFLGLRRWLARLHVNVVDIVPFGVSPACNKLRQLETFTRCDYERLVLMDCDTAYIGADRLPWGGPVMAKIADQASPPEPLLTKLFSAAGLGEPRWVAVTLPAAEGRRLTDRNNCNGGVYILDGDVLPTLAPEWTRWTRWCGEQGTLFGPWLPFADQVALAMACRSLGGDVQLLPIEWNFPTHVREQQYNVAPQVLHYHRFTTPDGRLTATGLSKPDAAISEVNSYVAGLPSLEQLDREF